VEEKPTLSRYLWRSPIHFRQLEGLAGDRAAGVETLVMQGEGVIAWRAPQPALELVRLRLDLRGLEHKEITNPLGSRHVIP
jgi:hypothetical protein